MSLFYETCARLFLAEPFQVVSTIAKEDANHIDTQSEGWRCKTWQKAIDVGFAYGPWGERYFFEAAGGGLLADYVQAAKKEEKKNKAIKKLSKEQEMARHSALLCRMLHDYPARKWKIELDGKDISGRYILWEAMNIHSVGPALYLAPRAGTRDGRFDFACARPADSALLAKHFEARE